MLNEPQWYSVLPPIIAIILAIKTKQVLPSLFAGIWIGCTLLYNFNPLIGLAKGFDSIINVFSDPGDTRILIFTLLIGALITTIEKSGGVSGFVAFLENRKWVHTGLRAQILAWMTGIVIFIESNITSLVAGSVSRPLFDRYKISREKLAYLIDATAAPVCVMVPLNAWTAVIIGLIASTGMENAFGVFLQSIPYNLYAITAIILAIIVVWKNINLGPMAAAEIRTQKGQISWQSNDLSIDISENSNEESSDAKESSAIFMILPILTMTFSMPAFLFLTGGGDIMKGNGPTAIFWSICAALICLLDHVVD